MKQKTRHGLWDTVLRYWLPTAAYMGLIFYFSSRQQPQLLRNTPDKVLHIVEYAPLGFLMARGLAVGLRGKTGSLFLAGAAAALSAAYGLSDELHQYFVPGRFCTAGDMAADGLGSLAGAAAYTICAALMVARNRRTEGVDSDIARI